MGPVFGVNTYWYRQEFAKSRGMVHWHGLCWRKDKEPHKLLHQLVEDELSESECATKLAEWARHEFRLSANHPAGFDENRCPRKNLWPPPEGTAPKPPEDTNPLTKLLLDVSESQDTVLEDYLLLTNRFNIHRCSDYCLQQSKHNPSIKQCRMEFGTHSNPGKELRDTPAIVKDKNSSLRLEMPRDHPMLMQHSQYHTQAWRANGDISIILSKSGTENPSVNDIIATERYITGYACKGNQVSESMSELVSNVVDMSDDSSCYSGKNICQKFLMNCVKRDISAVEASFEISRLPLYRCSHTFQNISLSGFRVLEKDGSTLTKSTPLDKYLQRNKDDNSSFYSFICSKGKVPVLSGLARPTWPLHEQYCKYMLFLHYPNWRKINDIIPEGKPWTQQFKEFLNHEKCPNFVKAQAESAKLKQPENDLAGDDICERLSSSQEPDWMNILKPNPNYATEDITFDDGGDTFDWGEMAYQYPHDLGKSFLSKLEDIDKDTAINIPACDLKTMNSDQLFSFNLVMKTVTDFSNNLSSFKPLRLVVSGTAGSGKSYLIKCLVAAIKLHFNSNSAVQVVCPTGNSANVIQGVTLHSFLKIPTYGKHKKMSAPQGNTGLSLQSQLKGLKLLLVDERSMIGANTLGWMEFMCRHGVEDGKNSCLSWGGLPVVVFFGDDVQLPPVLDSPVYSCKSKNPAALHGVMAWKEFEESVHLNTIVRQNESEKTFKAVLSSVRQNSVSPDQAIWLQKFQWDNLTSKYGKQLMKHMTDLGLFVFPTHRELFEHNRAKLIELNKTYPVARIQCVSKGCHAANVSRDKASGLPGNLFICKNAKVMLTVNLNVQYGLFNGAMGTVVDIIYHSNPKPDAGIFPDVIMVHFQSYSGPAFIEEEPKLVPIIAVERKIDCPCHYCKRKQIPLILGWGTTIHKCQGMTIGKGEVNRYIVIQPGTTTFESRSPGALFVALSRAKATGDKYQLPDFAWHQSVFLNEDRVCNKIRSNMKSLRDSEMLRLQKLSEATRSRYINLQQDKAFLNHYDTLFYQHLASEE